MQKRESVNRRSVQIGAFVNRCAAAALLVMASACSTFSEPPAAVDGRPDLMRFRVAVLANVPESHANQIAKADIEAYRDRNGFRAYSVVEQRWGFPGHFDYLVRFER